MTKMRHVYCKMLSLRKTKSLNTPCSPRVHFKKSDSTILTDVLSEYYSDWTSWLQSFNFTFYFYQQTWNIIYMKRRHLLSTKYKTLFTYNIVYILMKIIKSNVFLTDSDLLLFTWFKWWRHLWRLPFKYSSGLCKMRFHQYHLFSFQITSIFHLKKNISLISAHL